MRFLIGHPEHEFKGDVVALVDNLRELLNCKVGYGRRQLVGQPAQSFLEIRTRRQSPEAIAGAIRAELDKVGGRDVTVQLDT